MASRVIGRAAAVAAFASLAATPLLARDPMSTEVVTTANGLRVLSLSGAISYEDRTRVPLIISRGGYDEVWLNSPGGSVVAGFAIGRAMRKAGVIARVPVGSKCASACIYVFAGAPVRFADSPFSLGVHPASMSGDEKTRRRVAKVIEEHGDNGARVAIQTFEKNGSLSGAQQASYFLEMGVSMKLVEHLSKVYFSCMRWLSGNGVRYFNLVNTQGPPPRSYRPTDTRDVGSGC